MTKIELADEKAIPELVGLWRVSFGDGKDFIRDFIGRYMVPGYNVPVVMSEGRLAAAMYCVEFPLWSNNAEIGRAVYIYAAACLPELRGRGYMGELTRYAVELYRGRGAKAAFLIPGSEDLFAFWGKLGFAPYYKCSIKPFAPADGGYIFTPLDITDADAFASLHGAYAARGRAGRLVPVMDERFYRLSAESYLSVPGGAAGTVSYIKGNLCHIFYRKVNNMCIIDDIIPIEGAGLSIEALAQSAANALGLIFGVFFPPNHDSNEKPYAMLMPLGDEVERLCSGGGEYITMFLNF